MSVYKKLIEVQSKLKAPKNQKNTFGGYNYRSCEDIFEAVKPLLKEEKLVLRTTDELVQIGERYYIKATAIITDGKETIENVAYAREEEKLLRFSLRKGARNCKEGVGSSRCRRTQYPAHRTAGLRQKYAGKAPAGNSA